MCASGGTSRLFGLREACRTHPVIYWRDVSGLEETVNKRDTTDLRDQPAYTLADAARYLKVASTTLRAWVAGRPYPKGTGVAHSRQLIRPAQTSPITLSFWNLIEAHVLTALRTDHGVSLRALRQAIDYAERHLKIDRLLLSSELKTDAGRLLLERYGELIDLSASGQLAMRRFFDEHLKRVEWDARHFPVRLYPFTSVSGAMTERLVSIDPNVSFGRPVLVHHGISTRAIVDRIDAGELVKDVAQDYDLTEPEVEEAILYERAA